MSSSKETLGLGRAADEELDAPAEQIDYVEHMDPPPPPPSAATGASAEQDGDDDQEEEEEVESNSNKYSNTTATSTKNKNSKKKKKAASKKAAAAAAATAAKRVENKGREAETKDRSAAAGEEDVHVPADAAIASTSVPSRATVNKGDRKGEEEEEEEETSSKLASSAPMTTTTTTTSGLSRHEGEAPAATPSSKGDVSFDSKLKEEEAKPKEDQDDGPSSDSKSVGGSSSPLPGPSPTAATDASTSSANTRKSFVGGEDDETKAATMQPEGSSPASAAAVDVSTPGREPTSSAMIDQDEQKVSASTSTSAADVPHAGPAQHEVIPAPSEPVFDTDTQSKADEGTALAANVAVSNKDVASPDMDQLAAATIPPATVSVVDEELVPSSEAAPGPDTGASAEVVDISVEEGSSKSRTEGDLLPSANGAHVGTESRELSPEHREIVEEALTSEPKFDISAGGREATNPFAEPEAPVTENPTADDLFRSGETQNAADDLFAGIASQDGAEDPFAKVAQKKEDDPFAGVSSSNRTDGDLFGTSGGEADDDFFAEQQDTTEEDAPWSKTETKEAPVDDLFDRLAESDEPAREVPTHGGADAAPTDDSDIFANLNSGNAVEEDFFASAVNPEEASSAPVIDQSTALQSSEADLFGGSTVDEPWLDTAAPTSAPDKSSNALNVAAPDLSGADLDAMGVPEGWLDETGGWNWYTEDERIEVAQQMIKDNLAAAPVSESDARRTPVPDSPANRYEPPTKSAATSAYNPYDPPRPSVPTTNSYAPAPAAFTPPIASSSYLPPSSPYNPPSPATSRYAPAPALSQPYSAATLPRNFQPVAPPPQAPTPPAVFRSTTSTAYDPPILQPSAKLSRPASAAPAFVPPLPNAYAPAAAAPPIAAPLPPRAPPKPVASSMSRSGTPTAFDPPLPPPRPRPASRSSSFSQHQQQPLVSVSAPPVPPLPSVAPAPIAMPPPPRGPPRASSRANLRAEAQAPPPPVPPMPVAPPPPPPSQPQPHPVASYDRPRSTSPLASTHVPSQARSPPMNTQPGSPWAPKHRSQLSREATPRSGQTEPEIDDQEEAFDPEEGGFGGISAASAPRSRPGLQSDTFQPPRPKSTEPASPEIPTASAPVSNPYEPRAEPARGASSYEPPAHRVPEAPSTTSQPPPINAYQPPVAPSNAYKPSSISAYAPPPPSSAYQSPVQGLPMPQPRSSYGQPSTSMGYSPVEETLGRLAPTSAAPHGSPARTRSASTYDSPARPTTDQPASRSTYEPVQSVNNAPIEDDPLGRGSDAIRSVPCASFGHTGQLLLVFPSDEEDRHADQSGAAGYGFSSAGRTVRLRDLTSVVPTSAGSSSTLTFPGPLIFDGPAAKAASADKKKREAVDRYVADRIGEIETGLPYLTVKNDPQARSREEAKLVLMRLLQRAIAADGRPRDDPAELVAIIASTSAESSHSSKVEADSRPRASRSHLTSLLVHARREEALSYAIENHMWADALLVASSMGPEAWQRCITAYIGSELTPSDEPGTKLVLPAIYNLYGSTMDAFAHLTPQELGQSWRDILAAVIGTKSSDSAAEVLGDKLMAIGLIEAGHCCYLVSSLLPAWASGNAHAAAKYPLLGQRNTDRDEESTIYSELLEYALALRPAKDFAGVLHLLPYKINKAQHLLASGQRADAQRYCDSILGSLKVSRLSEASAPVLINLVDSLTAMLAGKELPNLALKRGAKPNLDKIGSWFEGRLTKFIAGDEGEAQPEKAPSGGVEVGPFSHYSTITPEAATQVSSRTPSLYDVHAMPPSRTPSAMAMRQEESRASQPAAAAESRPEAEHNASIQLPSWGQSYDFDDGAAPDVEIDGGELINPMQNLSVNLDRYAPQASSTPVPAPEDDEDDLGFGNATRSAPAAPKQQEPAPVVETPPEPKAKAEPAKEEVAKPAGGSWLGKWWGKKEDAPTAGPVRAKLGEKTSMYYDKELKRWVTPGASVEATKATPPPPKATTTKPAPSSAAVPPSIASMPTPPLPPAPTASGPPSGPPSRPASGPPVGPPRPAMTPSSSDPPLGDALAPPSRKPAKKNIRSRYVDVMK